MRQLWITATPVVDLKVNDHTVLCHLHFSPFSYQSEKVDQRQSRCTTLQRTRLKEDALPSIWPNCPAYLSKSSSLKRRTSLASAEAREAAASEQIMYDEKAPEPPPVEPDDFYSLDDIAEKLSGNSHNIAVVIDSEAIGLVSVSLGESSPKMRYAIVVKKDLTYEVYCCEMKQTDFPTNEKIVKLVQLTKLFSELESRFRRMTSPDDIKKTYLQSIVEQLQNSVFDDDSDQLRHSRYEKAEEFESKP